ncbi:ADP-ribose pyrophosphatase [Terribacillus saccharophilus]|uniref:ADP-ribose pyrophosphatase n=1 Tax=Terribacillus saccharophilus TaxID=361277 RepID=A0A268A936_9BACI|nr:NUDIX hydrolase [Terribacillus saccharophilus]PAD20640.1 ADP-ribose pyrophosphatase [Terribacillus saccharophilus]PAF17836.1 ADP-ribose pyrophosphatase [Terribacillus saccharophilus]PAF21647.1 ADP-ribose pyrophosphatase [Terribacillus saccharophilus]PAF34441.1 ADP-ribose pyrophosphatase [Terribacillus saccharophilus]PAF39417.1 ADP-ribose pyrophosphatase [Terribacillus saccharophilus]
MVLEKWLEWARRIQAISQAGLHFTKDVFDRERYTELQQLSAEIIANYTGQSAEEVVEVLAAEKGYPTPKLDIRGVVFQEGKLLLVKEKMDNRWSLPGGFCEVGLSASENAVKEIKEESGFDVQPIKLLAVLDSDKHTDKPQMFHYYKIFLQCDIVGGGAQESVETSEIGFFTETELPPLSLKRNTEAQINMLFESQRKPDKQSVFD